MFRTAFALFAAIAALTTAPALAQGEVEDDGRPWLHQPSGTIFPALAGGFSRFSLYEYDATGRDASAGYRLGTPDGTLVVSVFVYPAFADMDCKETFLDARIHIDNYDGETLLSQSSPRSILGTDAETHYARYFIPEGATPQNLPDIYSDLYLTCPAGGQWLVKYRASWNGSAETFPSVEPLLGAIAWPAAFTGG